MNLQHTLPFADEKHEDPPAARRNKKALGPPIKYHGGKHYLAARIIDLMPPHLHYVEPFLGGAAVLLARDPERDWYAGAADWTQASWQRGCSEVVNDISGELTTFWSVLQDEQKFTQFQRIVEATPFSEAEWISACQTDDRTDPVARAAAFFVRSRQSRQGLSKDFATLSRRRTRRGMNEQVSSWLTAIDGLPAVHERLKVVVVLNRPALQVIRQQDGPMTVFYCDPPYVHETRVTTGDYAHEMSTSDHRQLLELLAGIQGKFLLSGYHSPMYDGFALDHGWNLVEFQIDNKASSKAKKETKTECVWMNYEPAIL